MAGKWHEHGEHGEGGGAERQPGLPGVAAAPRVRSRFRGAFAGSGWPGRDHRGRGGAGPGQVQGRVLREDRQLELP